MAGWDGKIGAVNYKLDFPAQGEEGGTSANGTWTFQNSTPTDVRFQNSEPGFGDTAPYSARTYSNQAGSIGKQNEIQAPADLARPYQCDLDNSRPGYIAPRLKWEQGVGPNTDSVVFDNTPGVGTVNTHGFTLVDTSLYGLGTIVGTTGGSDAGLWIYGYDVGSRHYVPKRQVKVTALARPLIDTAIFRAQLRSALPYGVIHETNGTLPGATGTHIWVPQAGGGAVDAALTYAAQTVLFPTVKFWHFISFGGYLFSFEQADPNNLAAGMVIAMRASDTLVVLKPTTLSGIDAAPELGNADITETVPEAICAFPPLVYGGAIYCCTDRQVLKIAYDDENARILIVPIHTSFTRITGNPEIFQGSLIVPSGNTLWKWTPGQLEFTAIPVDSFGDLPENRGGGTVSALRAVANGLMLGMQSSPQDQSDACLLKMDTNNTFSMYEYAADNGVIKAGQIQQLIHFIDASYANAGNVVCFLTYGTGVQKRVIPVRESSRDPIFLPAAKRRQVAGSHWWMSPVDYGVNYGDFKQELRLAAGVADVTATAKIRIYYQIDYEAILPDQFIGTATDTGYTGSTVGTLMERMGRWHLAMTLDGSILDAHGQPQLFQTSPGVWAGYAVTSLVVSNIDYRAVRWAVEIISDPTGTVYPRLTGFKQYYSETPAMYIVHSLRIRILVNDPDLAGAPTTGAFPPPRDADDAYAHFNQIYTYARDGEFVDFLDPNGGMRKGKITKLIFNGVSLVDTPDGMAVEGRHRFDRMILQLAVQEADSAA